MSTEPPIYMTPACAEQMRAELNLARDAVRESAYGEVLEQSIAKFADVDVVVYDQNFLVCEHDFLFLSFTIQKYLYEEDWVRKGSTEMKCRFLPFFKPINQ